MKNQYIIALSFSLLLMFSLGGYASRKLVPSSYTTIQSAINAAGVGDTVLVEPGTYYENINFNGKNIVVCSLYLISGNPAFISTTIIDGNNNGISAITFNHSETNSAKLSGFTIQHANTQYTVSPNDYGGGIKIIDASPVIENCIIRNNYAFVGGGIHMGGQNCAAIVQNCTIEFNGTISAGGGIRMSDLSMNAIVQNCIIRNNTTTDPHGYNSGGGGICFYHSGKLANCLVINNSAPLAVGGGIYCDWGTYNGSQRIFVTGCTIANNSALSNGEIGRAHV